MTRNIRSGKLRQMVTFQKNINDNWVGFLTVHGHINGVSGNEFFIANAGYEAALTVTIECRFQPALMRVTPMEYRAVSGGIVYELISPGDDVEFMHRLVKFRAKRIYTQEDSR